MARMWEGSAMHLCFNCMSTYAPQTRFNYKTEQWEELLCPYPHTPDERLAVPEWAGLKPQARRKKSSAERMLARLDKANLEMKKDITAIARMAKINKRKLG